MISLFANLLIICDPSALVSAPESKDVTILLTT